MADEILNTHYYIEHNRNKICSSRAIFHITIYYSMANVILYTYIERKMKIEDLLFISSTYIIINVVVVKAIIIVYYSTFSVCLYFPISAENLYIHGKWKKKDDWYVSIFIYTANVYITAKIKINKTELFSNVCLMCFGMLCNHMYRCRW